MRTCYKCHVTKSAIEFPTCTKGKNQFKKSFKCQSCKDTEHLAYKNKEELRKKAIAENIEREKNGEPLLYVKPRTGGPKKEEKKEIITVKPDNHKPDFRCVKGNHFVYESEMNRSKTGRLLTTCCHCYTLKEPKKKVIVQESDSE